MHELARVFVYGTLTSPLVRLCVLRSIAPLQKATLFGYEKCGLTLHKKTGAHTTGYIIGVTPMQLQRLDAYERVPRIYDRVALTIAGQTVWAYIRKSNDSLVHRCIHALHHYQSKKQ